MSHTFHLPDLAATEAFGRRLGPLLFPGAVVALVGGMGAGKTHFVRAVAEGLCVRNPAAVTSPTFVLIQEYPARLPIYHFDAYRLNSVDDFVALGADEYFHGDGVCLVEWADRVTDALPAERLELHFRVVSDREREVSGTATGEQYEALLRAWVTPSAPSVL
jgi:tRNA threonylcarbamoyladenosine biosynthesis protein TsaE